MRERRTRNEPRKLISSSLSLAKMQHETHFGVSPNFASLSQVVFPDFIIISFLRLQQQRLRILMMICSSICFQMVTIIIMSISSHESLVVCVCVYSSQNWALRAKRISRITMFLNGSSTIINYANKRDFKEQTLYTSGSVDDDRDDDKDVFLKENSWQGCKKIQWMINFH